MADMENLFPNIPFWRKEPHLYCDFSIMNHFVGEYKTFLARVDASNPIRLFGGSTSVIAKIDSEYVKAEDVSKIVSGRFVQIIAKVCSGYIRIVHITIMPNANIQSLIFRNKVAQVLHEVNT